MNDAPPQSPKVPAPAPAPPKSTPGDPRDDRGRPITLLNIADLKRAESGPEPRRAALARRLRDAIRVESRRLTWDRFAIGVAGVIAIWCVRAMLAMLWPASAMWGFVVFWGGLILLGFVIRAWIRRKVARQLAVTAVAEGICGACAYTLEGVPAEADGCLICPECGAAWRQVRITRPHWNAQVTVALYEPSWWRRTFLGVPRSKDQLSPDDRGRFVRILDSRLQLLPPDRRKAWGRERFLPVFKAARRAGRVGRWAVASLALSLSVLGAVGMVRGLVGTYRTHTDRMGVVIPTAILAAVFAAVTVAILRSNMFAGPRAVVPRFRKLGLCACCGDAIDALAPDSDGYVSCRECGAAWRQVDKGRCLRCGYDLRGLPQPICPECGGRFGAPKAHSPSPMPALPGVASPVAPTGESRPPT